MRWKKSPRRGAVSVTARYFVAGNFMTLLLVPMGGEHCDFCRAAPVSKFYLCSNFEIGGKPVFTTGTTPGKWAACAECAELVDSRKWNTLTARVLQEFAYRHQVQRRELANLWAQFTEIHWLFAEHMLKEVSLPQAENKSTK